MEGEARDSQVPQQVQKYLIPLVRITALLMKCGFVESSWVED